MGPRAQRLSRRGFLAGAGIATAGLLAPPRAWALSATDGFRLLRARAVAAGGEAPPIGSPLRYDDSLPGPLLRIRRGEELRVRLRNDLPEPTSVHWHGVRLPNAMDGVPPLTQPAVAPGASFDYRFRPPDAGTYWYHAAGATQIDQGLHGALIVEEPQAIDADRDIALVVAMPVNAGDAPILVNGSLRPNIPVRRGERVRLRLINASAAQALMLRLDGHAPWVMAVDGQPAEPFVAREGRVGLGPGNRVDLFVDLVRERGTAAPLVAGTQADAQRERPIARLAYAPDTDARDVRRAPPLALPPNPLPARIDLKTALRADVTLADAKPFDPAGAPSFAVKRGRAVTLAIRNGSGRPWAVHVHGHHFRLLDRLDDGWKPYWMDTLIVGEQVERIAFLADNPGNWLIGCRMLERRDTEASHWFAVT
jgi:FtsP/CotA-like multicopper oxidase with cupredoxin domain